MKKIFGILFTLTLLTGAVFTYQPSAAADPAPAAASNSAAHICPVSGDTVKGDKFFADYDGKRYYFCCKGCIRKFKKNPAKYLGKA